MGFVYTCGVCVFCFSVWAVIQLTLMAFFFSIEASTLIEDVTPEKFETEKSEHTLAFVVLIKENYQVVSNNCYYAAYSYVVMIVVSWFIIFQGKVMDKKAAENLLGDDMSLLRLT